MHPRKVEERQRLALARIEDAVHRLAALAHHSYPARETTDDNDTRQTMMRETEMTADALNLIVVLLTPQSESGS